MRARALILTCVALGCGLASPTDDEADTTEDGGSGTSTGTGEGPNEFEEPAPCESTADCENAFCVAPYDPGAVEPIGESVCVGQCVGLAVLDRHCVDDDACCAPLDCDERGLCVEPEADDETTTG